MFDPRIAEIRFGTGLSPTQQAPGSADEMLNALLGRDAMAQRFAIEPYDRFRLRITAYTTARRDERRAKSDAARADAKQQRQQATRQARGAYAEMFRDNLLRRIHSDSGFRERLAFFWADHFTARGKSAIVKFGTSPYVQEAIRPHIAGKFEDLLIAAVTHPLMLHYLDQAQSVGPNSKRGKRQNKGLNENLAREVMELHTLGVEGPYSQGDVRQLAELFAGLSVDSDLNFAFKPAHVEPGVERVLGKDYGRSGQVEDVHAALRDLARHPSTARHIAFKLAQHFTAEHPDPDLITRMTAVYLDSGGDLLRVYVAMLDHPASWAPEFTNVKPPVDFIATALRALDIGETTLKRSKSRDLLNQLFTPLQIMGQPWESPNGPDGWPEENQFWITPQFMAARLAWALSAPLALKRNLPDPRDFAKDALGAGLPREVAFAASAAENRWEGIAFVLTSPAFQKY